MREKVLDRKHFNHKKLILILMSLSCRWKFNGEGFALNHSGESWFFEFSLVDQGILGLKN